MAVTKSEIYKHATESVTYISGHLPDGLRRPKVGIVCGSGLSGLSNAVRDDYEKVEIGYSTIPHFPQSTVHGHAGKFLFGYMGPKQVPVALMVGRVHFYEGHSIHDITFPIRVLKLLGIDILIVTNAAGGLNPDYDVGDIAVLSDVRLPSVCKACADVNKHLNLAGLAGVHPLRGPNLDEFGTRFPPLSNAYDLDLRRRAHIHWKKLTSQRTNALRRLHEGVYMYVGGPSYETRAECRMLRMFGADVVGMSTVPEVIIARHCGIRVLALSLVTNRAILDPGPRGDDPSIIDKDHSALATEHGQGAANHEEVIQAGAEAASDMQMLVYDLVVDLPE